jgi:hypothetical protein
LLLFSSQVKQLSDVDSQVAQELEQVIGTADPTGTSTTVADSATGIYSQHGTPPYPSAQTVQSQESPPEQSSQFSEQAGQIATSSTL